MSNRVFAAVLVFLVGLAIMIFGAYYATEVVVKCDGKVMQSGDICRKPKHGTRTYEEQRNLDHTMGWVSLGAGSAVLIGGIALAIWAYRRPAKAPRTYLPPGGPGSYPQPGAPPPYPPQYPPPPGGQPYYPPPRYPPPGPPWPQQ